MRLPILTVLLLVPFSLPTDSRASQFETVGYHEIKTDSKGRLVPWYSDDPGPAYDFVIRRTWEFWKNMKSCPNGVKYYMQHQVWAHPGEDSRGLGGDQISMALSSWSLLYPYLGDRSVVENMTYMADYWLDHGMSAADAAWPNLPYPYNTELHSGVYDGDMRAGKGFLQPDKAASFGAELITLYQVTGNRKYLNAAEAIADTLVAKMTRGDNDASPWPYRVHAKTGQVGLPYTANYTGALRLFEGLESLQAARSADYRRAFQALSEWLKAYPLKTNKWGPFFEDIPGWSNTEINADTMAWYMLEHPTWDADGLEHARRLLAWSRFTFANQAWIRYGLTAINEQTAYTVPGNSHTSRHASVQLIYAQKSGDLSLKEEAIRQLNWATYMVDEKGNNRYPLDDIWLTDGYGDYVRHYLRAMAAAPELSPRGQDHLLKSSSAIQEIQYKPGLISYTTSRRPSQEMLRISFAPESVVAGGKDLPRLANNEDLALYEGFTFQAAGDVPGVLRVRHDQAADVVIQGQEQKRPAAREQSVTAPENGSTEIRLAAGEDAPGLQFTVSPPHHGKITGTAPALTYSPEKNYLGPDAFSFTVTDGQHESIPALVRIEVTRPNLARIPGARAFGAPGGRYGAVAFFPALNDGDVETSVSISIPRVTSSSPAVGVVWDQDRIIRQVLVQQGVVSTDGRGGFGAGLLVDISENGSDWRQVQEWELFPSYPSVSVSLADYLFTLRQPISCRGVRIVGKSVGSDQPGPLSLREIQVFGEPAAPVKPEIDYEIAQTTIAAGQTAVMGVKMRPGFCLFQWQTSQDSGTTWDDVAGARGPYLAVKAETKDGFSGRQYRSAISNGFATVYSKPMTLTVSAAGSPEVHGSNQPLK